MQQKPAGLKLRGGIWHVDKAVHVGDHRKSIRRSTGCSERELDQAIIVLEQWISEAKEEMFKGPKRHEHIFQEAAVKYVLSIERKGKDPARAIQDLRLIDTYIGELPLSHVHQGTLSQFEQDQKGVRRSSTIARVYRTIVATLNYSARVLRDGSTPWLTTAVPKITPPDWADRLPPYRLDWSQQDTLISQLDRPQAKHLVPAVLFGVATGAREQEICSLTWDQEILAPGMPKGSVWWIPPEIRKGNSRREASRQAGRYLVANAMARAVIEGQQGNMNPLVFPGPKGERMLRINNSAWRTAWKRAGLPAEGFKRGVHNLRHTFGDRLETAGVPWEYRKVLLGHEIHDVTAHYSAPGLVRLLEEVEKVQRGTTPILRPVTQTPHKQKITDVKTSVSH